MKKILIVDDEPNIVMTLEYTFKKSNYEVFIARDGQEALDILKTNFPDVIILDIMMPKKDGFTLGKELKKVEEDLPIIYLTAKNLKDDVIEGLKIGADDYITKPFSMEELLLRINAILRRTKKSEDTTPLKNYRFGDFVLHYDQQQLDGPKGTHKLTSKENELLRLLASELNKNVSRSQALKQIWGDDSYFNARSMDVYLSKVRKLLKDDPKVQIITLHGEGFKLVAEES